METTTLKTTGKNVYQELVNKFMQREEFKKISSQEKEKFLMLCTVNQLNPFKNQVYAVPYGDKLQLTVDYRMYLERAEATGKLYGWRVVILKKDGVVKGWSITIHRKDRKEPFVYEADITDHQTQTPLWKTKPEAMMRKQLIRVGFAMAFPENCGKLGGDMEDEPIESESIEATEVEETPISPSVEELQELADTTQENMPLQDEPIPDPEYPQKASQDQELVIKQLSEYLPEDDIECPEWYYEAEQKIVDMKIEIGRLFLKEQSLNLSEDEVKQIFSWDNQDVKNIKKAALKFLADSKK